ncbi:MAG: TPR end-of-group domain-containing protein [Acidobacteriota bacterium]
MMQETKSAAVRRKKSAPDAAKAPARANNGAAFQQYQTAVQLVQQGKYDKALGALEKLLATAPPEIAERCRMYITTCQRQLEPEALKFASPEERFDFAIAQMNGGDYEDAREHLDSVLSERPEADYALYGLAVLDSITGRSQECLTNLARAIELNPRNRLQARSDNDFQNMVDDPRFTELLYPEIP